MFAALRGFGQQLVRAGLQLLLVVALGWAKDCEWEEEEDEDRDEEEEEKGADEDEE